MVIPRFGGNAQMGSDRSLHVHVIMWKTLLYAPRVGSWWWKTLRDGGMLWREGNSIQTGERQITGVSMKGERAVGRWFCNEMRWKRWMATN